MFRFLSSENICAVQDLYKYMYKIFIYNGPKLEKTQISNFAIFYNDCIYSTVYTHAILPMTHHFENGKC